MRLAKTLLIFTILLAVSAEAAYAKGPSKLGGGKSGVSKITAGTNVTVSPTSGKGDVTVSANAAASVGLPLPQDATNYLPNVSTGTNYNLPNSSFTINQLTANTIITTGTPSIITNQPSINFAIAGTTIVFASTVAVQVDVLDFVRVNYSSSVSTDLSVATFGLVQFDPINSSGTILTAKIRIPQTLSAYNVIVSSFVEISTGVQTAGTNYTLTVSTCDGDCNFMTKNFQAPVTVAVSGTLTNGGERTAQNITLTGWNTEIAGRILTLYIRVARTTGASNVPTYFGGMTITAIGKRQ